MKSCSSLINQDTANANRREIKHTQVLQGNPRVPKLLRSFEKENWVTLIYEVVEGKHPDLPWRMDELEFVLNELALLSASITPCPQPEIFDRLEDNIREEFMGWNKFARANSVMDLKDEWIGSHLDMLVRLENKGPTAAKGNSLVHADLRADQIILASGKAVFLDWPHAMIGAPWVDFLFLFPSIELRGGPEMASLMNQYLLRDVNEDQLIPMTVALAGSFLWNSIQAPPPRLVTIRKFQRDQGDIVMKWLKSQFR